MILLVAIPSFTTATIHYLFHKSSEDSEDQRIPTVKEQRQVLWNLVDRDSVEALDEYWEIFISLMAVFFVAIALIDVTIQGIADWIQILVTVVFWVSYKVGKARQSIDLRIMTIGAAVQFLVLISSLLLMFGLIQDVVIFWLNTDAYLDPITNFPSLYWYFRVLGAFLIGAFGVGVSKYVGVEIGIRCYQTIKLDTTSDKKEELDVFGLHLVKGALPSYLFYGLLWFIAFIIPFTVATGMTDNAFAIFLGTAILSLLLVFGWLAKIWYANRVLQGITFSGFWIVLIRSIKFSQKILSGFFLILIGPITFYALPLLIFSYAVQMGSIGTAILSGMGCGLVLLTVHLLSFLRPTKKHRR
ncbi:MAG: hypothetical protein GF411_18550 [Candidatus Lokiarchaeota archaeon]|nr:hypothetical protein [Candidatus Lokiarchaeota archaeon]